MAYWFAWLCASLLNEKGGTTRHRISQQSNSNKTVLCVQEKKKARTIKYICKRLSGKVFRLHFWKRGERNWQTTQNNCQLHTFFSGAFGLRSTSMSSSELS